MNPPQSTVKDRLHRRAFALRHQNRVDDCFRAWNEALDCDPSDHMARCMRALTLLTLGRLEEGFRDWNARWEALGVRRPAQTDGHLLGPAWNGSSLCGKRILLHGEQGIGDAIQFVRYAPLLTRQAAEVVLEVSPALRSLFALLIPSIQVGTGTVTQPYDTHCSLLDLPAHLGTGLDSVPKPAQFSIPADTRARWQKLVDLGLRRNGRALRVGLVWAGNPFHPGDAERSIASATLLPLLAVPRVQFFGLQIGPAEARFNDPRLIQFGPRLSSFVETAAAILALDAVVTVDTSVAHLAGSLGCPTYVMLPFAACWRWLLNRNDSPWYPSLRLFRQAAPGDWTGVVHAVAETLSIEAPLLVR